MARLKLKHSLEVKVRHELRNRLKQLHQYTTMLWSTKKKKREAPRFLTMKSWVPSTWAFMIPSDAFKWYENLLPRVRPFSVNGYRTPDTLCKLKTKTWKSWIWLHCVHAFNAVTNADWPSDFSRGLDLLVLTKRITASRNTLNWTHLFYFFFLFKELQRTSKAPLSIRPEAASLVELLTKLNTGLR